MSINLQQQAPVRVELKTGSGESIAIHRALGSILFYSPTEGDGGTFEIFRREGIEIEGNWVKTGSWDLPPNQFNASKNKTDASLFINNTTRNAPIVSTPAADIMTHLS